MSEPDWKIRETGTGVDVPLHVQPRARRDELAGFHNGALKLRITAPPVNDAANRSVIAFFSSLLDIPKSRLEITSGLRSREKILHVHGISRAEFLARLNRS